MTGPSTTRLDIPWWRYLGPWDIRPGPVALFTAIFFLFTALATAVLEAQAVANVSFAEQALSVVVAGLTVWVLLIAARRWQRRHPFGLLVYLAIFLVAAASGVVLRAYLSGIESIILATPLSFLATLVRLWIPLVTVNSIIGVTTERLRRQIDQTETALALAREQQEWLIDSDERARRQVADDLHDRVQAGLIAACLQLQAVDARDPAQVDAVIQRLEEMRRIDVRRAARALSPTLSEVGLSSSLSELAAQYEPGMVTVVAVDPLIDGQGSVDERTRLGLYRIAEQALLNAAGHGRARTCQIRVQCEDSDVVMTIEDDGDGFPSTEPRAGTGAALISTWARTLGGTWSWGPGASRGTRLRASVPTSAAAIGTATGQATPQESDPAAGRGSHV